MKKKLLALMGAGVLNRGEKALCKNGAYLVGNDYLPDNAAYRWQIIPC